MQTYFLGLLGAATVLLGIAVAFLVAFVQIAAGRFSAAVAVLALKDWQVRLWLVGLAVVFAALGGASLILSLPPPHPSLGSLTRDQERVVVALGGLVAVLSGLGFVLGLVRRAVGFNSAPRLAEGVVRAVGGDELLSMIDEREVTERLRNRAMADSWRQALARVDEQPPVGNDASTDQDAPEGTAIDPATVGPDVPFTIDLTGTAPVDQPQPEEPDIRRPANRSYPLLPIIELLNQAVRDGDRVTVSRTLEALQDRWPSWLSAAKDDVRRELLLVEVRESLFESFVELIDRHGVPSLYRVYLPEVGLLAQRAYAVQPALLGVMLVHLTRTVVQLVLRREDDAAAAGVKALFALERAVSADADAAIEVHEALGSIGRTVGHLLPDPLGFAFDSPGFGYLDEGRSSVLAALREGYYELADRAPTVGNPADSRIWLEAVEVTILALLERAVHTGQYRPFREHVTDLLSDLCRAVEVLTHRGCDVCLSIGLLALKRLADVSIDVNEESVWQTIGTYVLRLGMIAEDRNHTGFTTRSGADDAVGVFSRVPDRYRASIVLDVFIHAPEGTQHDTVLRFIKRAGVKLGTNFDMMFDPLTGENYAEDDPRRR